jgi:hypothetical protein
MFGLSAEEISELSDEQLEELYDKIVFVRDAMPGEWLDHSDELRDAAELLWHDKSNGLRTSIKQIGEIQDGDLVYKEKVEKYYSISRPYLLLAGFSMENVFKGLRIARNPSLINTGRLDSELKEHRLLVLAEKLDDIKLSEAEAKFCKVAQDAIPYWGRYPIPLSYNRLLPEVGLDGEMRRTFLDLQSRLGARLHRAIRDGWDSGVGPESLKRRSKRYGDDISHNESPFE